MFVVLSYYFVCRYTSSVCNKLDPLWGAHCTTHRATPAAALTMLYSASLKAQHKGSDDRKNNNNDLTYGTTGKFWVEFDAFRFTVSVNSLPIFQIV